MNVLVIGSGGREHAICRSFRKSKTVGRLFCANGNAGIAEIAERVDIRPDEISSLLAFALENSIDLTFVGGETPLALGVVDEFEANGLRIIGPRQAAARLEASKSFAKDFMARHNVATARYLTARGAGSAVDSLRSGYFGGADKPVVIKADGLAAGKGVVVAADRTQAIAAVNDLESLVGAAAAQTIVIEECLTGPEVSLLMFADGDDFALMPATRDHKRIGEGDTGPNTGGMGTITDDSLLTPTELDLIIDTIVRATLAGGIKEGFPFRGILFLGLMMTPDGPKLLEYNVRFGDPETQAILVRLDSDIVEICDAMLNGTLGQIKVEWRSGSSACVVLAASGYPSKPTAGDAINGLAEANAIPGIEIFHAGTALDDSGNYVTAGGRVLAITAAGPDLSTSLRTVYSAVDMITWPGMQFRRDIGAMAARTT